MEFLEIRDITHKAVVHSSTELSTSRSCRLLESHRGSVQHEAPLVALLRSSGLASVTGERVAQCPTDTQISRCCFE
jgi:hypothetical protein